MQGTDRPRVRGRSARLALAVFLAVASSSCTSMRIAGMVTDEETGEPVGTCGIVSGSKYARTDPIGRYTIAVKRQWNTMQVIAPGYETRVVAFGESETRRPVIDVKLRPKAEVRPKP